MGSCPNSGKYWFYFIFKLPEMIYSSKNNNWSLIGIIWGLMEKSGWNALLTINPCTEPIPFLNGWTMVSKRNWLTILCCCIVTKSCPILATPWTVAPQASLSMRFSRQEYWSRLPFASPGDLPDSGIKLASLALAGRFFTTEPPGKCSTA